jgi:hypothetical protein
MGFGDRFGCEAGAQLRAVQRAEVHGVDVVPVWNKSFREHSLIGSRPDDVRAAADDAVRQNGWRHSYYVDADHVGLKSVDAFLASSDFFTLDVADFIGCAPPDDAVASFVRDMAPLRGTLRVPGVEPCFDITTAVVERFASQYLYAVGEAGRTYERIASVKGPGHFVTEVSLDEAPNAQTPLELFLLLGALGRSGIPVQTVAPKFSGKFLKGVDYVGDTDVFAREFASGLAVLRHAAEVFGLLHLPKISVHTGSDKFSLYPIIRRAIRMNDAGLHLKTAGTTWLEEVVGIALSGSSGFAVVKEIYLASMLRFDELRGPYASVVDIDRAKLPSPVDVERWTPTEFVSHLRHDPACPIYSVHMRQLVHIAFKIAAEMGQRFRHALEASREATGALVTDNLFERHIRPLFID